MKRVACAILGALVLQNLLFLVANQMLLEPDYRLVVKPRDIEKVAEAHGHPVVNGRVALYHYLGQRIAGATLTVPPWMDEHRWFLERVSGLRVIVDPAPPLLAREQAIALRKQSPVHRSWLRMGNKRERRRWQVVHLLLEGPTREYRLVEGPGRKPGKLGPVFIAPSQKIEEVLAR